MGNIRHGIVPVVLVLDRDIALEVLALQFIQNAFRVSDTGSVNSVGECFADGGSLLQPTTVGLAGISVGDTYRDGVLIRSTRATVSLVRLR